VLRYKKEAAGTSAASFLFAEMLVPPPNGSYHRRIIRTERRTVRTAEKSFVPPKNHSYQLPNDLYRQKIVRTTAEPFVPTAEQLLRPPNDSYR